MNLTIKVYTTKTFPQEKIVDLYNLSYTLGGMRAVAIPEICKRIRSNMKIICAYDKNNRMIGWTFCNKRFRLCGKYNSLMIYVDENYRGKGVGSALIEETKKYTSQKYYVAPHDEISKRFFNKTLAGTKSSIRFY